MAKLNRITGTLAVLLLGTFVATGSPECLYEPSGGGVATGRDSFGGLGGRVHAAETTADGGEGGASVSGSERTATKKAAKLLVDPKLPEYVPDPELTKLDYVVEVHACGSDTMHTSMEEWAKVFHDMYPKIKVLFDCQGSGTAPPALANDTIDIGLMSRKMKRLEEKHFKQRHGFEPTRIIVAVDCLAVYVHRDNPIQGMTLAQLDGVFGEERRTKTDPITTWGQLGLTGDWDDRPIKTVGRNNLSGTFLVFKEVALQKGPYRKDYQPLENSEAVVAAIAQDPGLIGYSGIGYLTDEVRAVPLAVEAGGEYMEANFPNALSGKYKLGRGLQVYLRKKPNEDLPPRVREFVRFILSKQGQTIVAEQGFGAIPAAVARAQYSRIAPASSN